MKYFLSLGFLFFTMISAGSLFGQTGSAMDRYIGAPPVPTIIGTDADNLFVPQDLKFSPVASRKNELWVVNYGDYGTGGYMVIFYNAGKPNQRSEFRHDSHSAHFMVFPTAFAMGSPDSAYFATIGEALNSVGDNTSTFMGPVLWDSDTTKFARINQNDWVDGQPLGSHIDMLHQSPYSMGIAFDTLNRYWVFDGYHGCLFHYDFNRSHGYGGDDHSDGKILKYKEVKLKRVENLPSHMIVDKSTGWLYIVDNGNNRILRVDTKSGKLGNQLTAPDEELLQYNEMTGVKWQTVDSGFSDLSGISYLDGRLIVGNNATGDIRVYNTKTSPKPTYLGTISTGDAGMTGLTIGPDSNIWYINTTKNQVVRLAPGPTTPLAAALISPSDAAIQIPVPAGLVWEKTNNATAYHLQVSQSSDLIPPVYDSVGITGTSMNLVNLSSSQRYYWRVSAKNVNGEGRWSVTWSFRTMGAKPDSITLLSPGNGETVASVNITLAWDQLNPATGYDLQVSKAPDFAVTLQDQKNITLPHFSLLGLTNSTKYYWRARGLNDGAIGEWSDTWSFTTPDQASVNQEAVIASKISIDDIYPNPSSINSTIGFTIHDRLHLHVAVYDLLGKELSVLANDNFESGKYSLNFNTASLNSGTYYYKFTLSEGVILKPFIVRK